MLAEITLIGFLGGDLHPAPMKEQYCIEFSVANHRKHFYKDIWNDVTDWFTCVYYLDMQTYNKHGNKFSKYKRGSLIYVRGNLQVHDKLHDNVAATKNVIIVEKMKLLNEAKTDSKSKK